MSFITSIEVSSNRKLAVPRLADLEYMEYCLLKSMDKSKSDEMKKTFKTCINIIELAKICDSNFLNIKSTSNSLILYFDFYKEADMTKFIELIANENIL